MYQQQIEAYFHSAEHRQQMLDAIVRLCRIPSEKGSPMPGKPYGEGPAAALGEALKLAQELGFPVKNYDNYVGAVDLCDKASRLDILAHLDVVPAGEGWTVTEPFAPLVVGDRIYGRGTADDKGPAICALFAMKAVKDLGIPLSGNCRLILGCDEECGSSDIRHYYAQEPEAPMTFSPDADFPVINTEKGSLHSPFTAQFSAGETLPRIYSVECGVKVNVVPGTAKAVLEGISAEETREYTDAVTMDTGVAFQVLEQDAKTVVTAVGTSGHAAMPENANNALTALLELLSRMPFAPCEGLERIQAIHQMFPHGDYYGENAGVAMEDFSGKLTISLNMLHYDLTSLKGVYDCRASLCATDNTLRDVLMARFAKASIQMEDTPMNPAHHVPEDSPFIQALLRCYQQYTGEPGRCIAIGGGTYVHHLKNGVAFGCSKIGVDNHMHGVDEFAEISQLLLSAKIFTQAIIELCAQP